MQPESVAGALFSSKRSHVLLILRRDVPVWVLPGGGREENESPEEAIIREIFEETGFHVKISRFVGAYSPINRLAKGTHLYECAILSGQATPSSETKGVRFFPLPALPDLPPPYLEWIQDAAKEGAPPVYKKLTSVSYGALARHLVRHPLLVIRFLLSRIGLAINSK